MAALTILPQNMLTSRQFDCLAVCWLTGFLVNIPCMIDAMVFSNSTNTFEGDYSAQQSE